MEWTRHPFPTTRPRLGPSGLNFRPFGPRWPFPQKFLYPTLYFLYNGQICRASAAAEMLSPPPTVCTTCLHTITGATQISMLTPASVSRQQTTGLAPVNWSLCWLAGVFSWSIVMAEVSRSKSLAWLTSTVREPHVCRYAVSDALAMAAAMFGHSLLSASVTITYTQWQLKAVKKIVTTLNAQTVCLHMGSQCYLPPDTGERTHLNPN